MPSEIRLTDPCLVVLVGAAGAGKSTFASQHFGADVILSSDTYRGLVSGDPTDQRATRPAFAALHAALRKRLHDRLLTVVDATNVTTRARAALLREASIAGLPAIAIALDLPADLVLARNRARRGGSRSRTTPSARTWPILAARSRTVSWPGRDSRTCGGSPPRLTSTAPWSCACRREPDGRDSAMSRAIRDRYPPVC